MHLHHNGTEELTHAEGTITAQANGTMLRMVPGG